MARLSRLSVTGAVTTTSAFDAHAGLGLSARERAKTRIQMLQAAIDDTQMQLLAEVRAHRNAKVHITWLLC